MKLVHLCTFALPVAAAFAVACGAGGSSSSGSPGSSSALHGAYVPVGDSVASAEYRALVFTSDADYFSYENNCTGASCRAEGTYVFDGTTLDLHPSTGKSESLSFKTLQTASIGSLIGDIVMSNGGTPLVNSSSSPVVNSSGSPIVNSGMSLVSGDGGSLLSQILQALINGAMMALEGSMGSGDDGGGSSGNGLYCDPVAAATDCAAQGGNMVTIGADGSCTCTVVVDAGPPADAAPTPIDITVTITNGSDAGADGGT
jgi:hypothetical protein